MFKELQEMLEDGDKVTISVMRINDELSVSVLPNNKASVKPMNLTATAEELDEKFIETIRTPLARSKELSTNIEEFEQSAKDAAAKAKPTKTTSVKTEKEKEKEKEDKAIAVSSWHTDAKAAIKGEYNLNSKEGAEKAVKDLEPLVELKGFDKKDLNEEQTTLLGTITKNIAQCKKIIETLSTTPSLF
jgi:PRTRC genetic system protein E